MATLIRNRRKLFVKSMLDHLGRTPRGTWEYRKELRTLTGTIANDFAKTGNLPLSINALKPEMIYALVEQWKRKQLSVKTMQNKLGALRRAIGAANHSIIIPSNQELGIVVDSPKPPQAIQPHASFTPPDLPAIAIIHDWIQLQYLFGLKAKEAFRMDSGMINGEYLEVSRSISYNSKDRHLRIETAEQRECLASFRAHYNHRLMQEADYRQGLIHLYTFTIKQMKIRHPDYFRHQYLMNRFKQLRLTQSLPKTLQILKTELGYSKLLEIRQILDTNQILKVK